MAARRFFTSESVTEGHPDKICDKISDSVLDALLAQDPYSRVACETTAATGQILIMGEVTTKATIDVAQIARDAVREIGYTRGKYGFDAYTCGVITAIDEQSSDIAMGVDAALELKNGDMTFKHWINLFTDKEFNWADNTLWVLSPPTGREVPSI